jgi:poly(beta-D-mannuronate) lyase
MFVYSLSIRPIAAFAISLVILLFLGAPDGVAADLQAPFDIHTQRSAFGAPVLSFNCPTPTPPVRDLLFEGFYADRGQGSSIVDPKAKQHYDEAVQPIRRFEKSISELSDLYVRSQPAKGEIAQCVLNWLFSWAKGEAMLGKSTQQGGFVRKWSLGTVGTSYLKVRDDPTLEVEKKAQVERWVGRWASVVKEDYSTGVQRESRRNNHLYWAAWSVTTAAVVLNDRRPFDWGVEGYRFALEQIQQDGTLPLELKRKSKALHYHLFSIAPLVLVAETGVRNGIDLHNERGGILHKLIRRSVEALDSADFFQRTTGYSQDWVGQLSGDKLAWMEPYYVHFPDGALKKWIDRFRPFKDRWLGGDLTLLYASRTEK